MARGNYEKFKNRRKKMTKKNEKREEFFASDDEFTMVEDLRRAYRLLEKRLEEAEDYESFISGPEFQNIDSSEDEDRYLSILNSSKCILRDVCTTKESGKALLECEHVLLNDLENTLKDSKEIAETTRKEFLKLAEKISSQSLR